MNINGPNDLVIQVSDVLGSRLPMPLGGPQQRDRPTALPLQEHTLARLLCDTDGLDIASGCHLLVGDECTRDLSLTTMPAIPLLNVLAPHSDNCFGIKVRPE